jgi:hypothetical protein
MNPVRLSVGNFANDQAGHDILPDPVKMLGNTKIVVK